MKVAPLCLTLCDHIGVVHGILQAKILKWVALPFSRGYSQPRDQTQDSHIAGGFLTSWTTNNVKRYPCLWCFSSYPPLWWKCSFARCLQSLLAPLLWFSNKMSYLRAFLLPLCKTVMLVPLMFKLLTQSYLFCITVTNLHFYFFIIFLFPVNLLEWRNSALLFILASPIQVWYKNTKCFLSELNSS